MKLAICYSQLENRKCGEHMHAAVIQGVAEIK